MSAIKQYTQVKHADAVIIGGGVVGAAITYFLAHEGFNVCLLEKNDIASGTTSAAAVAALLQTKTSAEKLALADRSLTLLDELHEQFDQSFEYKHSGSLLVANSEEEMTVVRDMANTLQALGLDVALVDGATARSIMPLLGDTVLGGSYSARDALINPLSLVTSYVNAARRSGAQIYAFTEVISIEIVGEQIVAVQTDKGRIQTDTVINAAGVWSPQLARMIGFTLPIVPLKGELLITEALPPQLQGTLISAKYLLSKAQLEKTVDAETPKRSVGITLAQVSRGNFVVGSTREQAGFNRQSTYAGISEQCRQLLDLTPALAHVHLIRAYAGLRPISPDGLPIIGRVPQCPGMIIASGFGGDGLALSAIAAEIVLGLIKNTTDPDAIKALSVNRFDSNEVHQ
jgi:sarcosine oxidase subunit beta